MALPYDLRKIQRIDVRPNEGVHAELIFQGENLPLDAYDLSPIGLCVIGAPEHLGNLKPLDDVYVSLKFSWGENFVASYCVCWIQEQETDKRLKLGLRLNWHPNESELRPEDNADMVPVPTASPIIGYIYKDFFYYEKCVFYLRQVSKTRALIEIADTEIILYPGKPIELLFALQTSKGNTLRTTVESIIAVEHSKLQITLQIPSMPRNLENNIVNHVIGNSVTSLEKIRMAGLKVREVANNFRFRYVKTHEEYLEVLKLRLAAYRAAGKVTEGRTFEDMAAPLDHLSRILIAYHGDKIVASVAMSFPDSEDVILDTERPLPGSKYPPGMPEKKDLVEIARLCTDQEYRRGDLLVRMFEHIYRVAVSSGRKYLISSCDDSLWPIYKRISFKKTGSSYAHPYLAGIQHHLILGDLESGTKMKRFSVFSWMYLYSTVTSWSEKRFEIKRTRTETFKVRFFTLLANLIPFTRRKKY